MKAPQYQQPASLLGSAGIGEPGDKGYVAPSGLAGSAQQSDLAAIQALLRGDTANVLSRYGTRNALAGSGTSPLVAT